MLRIKVIGLYLIVSYIVIYIFAMFSPETRENKHIFKATIILSVATVGLGILGLSELVSMIVGGLVSIFVFIKLIGFDPLPAFILGGIYQVACVFLLGFML